MGCARTTASKMRPNPRSTASAPALTDLTAERYLRDALLPMATSFPPRRPFQRLCRHGEYRLARTRCCATARLADGANTAAPMVQAERTEQPIAPSRPPLSHEPLLASVRAEGVSPACRSACGRYVPDVHSGRPGRRGAFPQKPSRRRAWVGTNPSPTNPSQWRLAGRKLLKNRPCRRIDFRPLEKRTCRKGVTCGNVG